MRTVLIDRSLVGMDFDKPNYLTSKSALTKALHAYAESLREAGAGYVEMDEASFLRLPEPTGAENYIYRIGIPDDVITVNNFNFAYALVPLKEHHAIPFINKPVILEVEVGQSDVFCVLQLISENVDFSGVSMIRVIGDFEADMIPQIVGKYKRTTVIPLDICPTNNTLSALDSVIAAFRSNSDAVTVRFGDYERFASLEELLIMLSAVHKTRINPHYLAGICKASIFLSMLGEDKISNLAVMIKRYMYRPIDIENVDEVRKPQNIKDRFWKPPGMSRIQLKTREVPNSPAARVLRTMGIDSEMSEQILEILKSCNMDILSEFDDRGGRINKEEEIQ